MNHMFRNIQPNRRFVVLTVLILVFAVVLAACQAETPTPPLVDTPTVAPSPTQVPPTEAPSVDLEEVYANLWVLVAYGDLDNPTVVERDALVTIEFSDDGNVNGSSGCNNYFGTVELETDGTISQTSPFGSTMMACESGMELETAFLTALEGAQRLDISPEGRLQIYYQDSAGGEGVLVFAKGETPLLGTQWILISYGAPGEPTPVQAGTTISAIFDEENIAGSAGCNSYTGAYTIEDDQISFGPVASTMMFCEDLMDQETAYLEALETAESYQLVGKQLTITYDDGQGLLIFTSENLPLELTFWRLVAFNGEMTPEEPEITALFAPDEETEGGILNGFAGCNDYSTGYTLEGENLSLGPIATTLQFCEETMDAEQVYLTALEGAQSFTIIADTLEITSDAGSLTYAADRTPLTGALWVLAGMGDPENLQLPVEGANFTAQFSRSIDAPSGVMAGTTGCNEYSAAFSANLDEIKINLPQATDNSGCSPALNLQEEQYFEALNSAATYQISRNLLAIPYGEEQDMVLLFTGTQLEVAGKRPLTELDSTTWYLHLINSQMTAPGTEVTAQFTVEQDGESGLIFGSGGCNAYAASFGQDLGVVAVLTSEKVCNRPAGVMEQEANYIRTINRAYGYWLTGRQLVVNTGLGALTFRTTPPDSAGDQAHLLQGVTWYLVSYGDQESVPADTEPNVFFDADGSLNGNTGCNAISGQYETNLEALSVSQLQVAGNSCMDDASSQQQEAMVAGLNTAETYKVAGNQMQIVAESGVLNFSKVPVNRPEPVPPPAAVIEAPEQAQVGEVVTFDGSNSSSEVEITSYEWFFGDGETASGAVVQHAYAAIGIFQVELTVKDELGNTSSATHDITTVEAPPDQTPPTAVIQGPADGFVAEPVTFTADGSTPGSSPITSYAWDFGNGTGLEPGSPSQVTVLFDQPGTYTVIVTVTDENGLSSNASMEIVIDTRLEGAVWVLDPEEYELVPGTSITLQFLEGELVGFSGCNSYSGAYDATQNPDGTYAVTISSLESTRLACPEDILEQEELYLELLELTNGASIDGNLLSLFTQETTLEYYDILTPNP